MKPELAARVAALEILSAVVIKQKTTDMAFADCARWGTLSQTDKAFARALVLTTLRRFGQITRVLAVQMAKPLPAKRLTVQLVLMLGVAQLLFLKTPAYAAINTSVELTRVIKQNGFTKLVNAVLRRVTADNLPPVRANVPNWLWQSWIAAYGEKTATAIAEAIVGEPPLDITVKSDPDMWAKTLNGTVLPTGGVRLTDFSDVTTLAGFETGDWWVQEAAASIPAQLFTDVRNKHVADLCAAPGGKTAQVVMRGGRVTAFDISEHRLKRLRQNMVRLGLEQSVTVQVADATQLTDMGVFDAVLLDAPCSATGTLLRHPEILRHRTLADVQRLAATQKQLLCRAIDLVKSGGEIVYSTCSLQPEENEILISAVLAENKNIRRVPLADRWAFFLNESGAIQMIPGQTGTDGFYAVLLCKK